MEMENIILDYIGIDLLNLYITLHVAGRMQGLSITIFVT